MCGIAGRVELAEDQGKSSVWAMLGSMGHRGPNSTREYKQGGATLGHTRLSILDLSEAGSQPMGNETQSVWVAANGEIYNYIELRNELRRAGHEFRSNSDSEVIVHGYEEWGIAELLRRLRGMYAFAIYDSHAEKRGDKPFLYLARDRMGIKPLYYHNRNGEVTFASEVQALWRSGAVEKDPDLDAIAGFLSLGSIPSPRTHLRAVQCLPPGHYLEVGHKGISLRKYWDLSYGGPRSQEDLAGLLEDTVRRHMIADVPVGVFLSGGLDSGALVALASRNRQAPLVTLTVSFEEEEYSEARAAAEVAKAFGTQHHEILVREQDFLEELPKILRASDQPTADGVNTYFVSRAARQLGLTVVLSGLGGDEVFFGYPHYRRLVQANGMLAGYSRSPLVLRRMLEGGASLYGALRGQEKWQRVEYLRGRSLACGLYLLMRGFYPPADVCELAGVSQERVDRVLNEALAGTEDAAEDVNQFHYLEMKRYLHDQLLRDSDVFSMAHSLELRVPFLDHEVVEWNARVPASEKLSREFNKPQLLNAVPHPLLEQAARRRKQGFTFPFARWMRKNAEMLEERATAGGVLDSGAVRRVWKAFRQGRLHWSRAWASVVISQC